MFELEHLLDARFYNTQVFLVWVQPLLIRVLERRGERGHDLTTIPEIAPNFSPLLLLADALEAASGLNGFLEFIQIQGSLVDAREAIEVMSILLVELGELIEVVIVHAIAAFDRVELLTSGSEVEALF